MSDVYKILLKDVMYCRSDVVVDNQINNYSLGSPDQWPEGHHGTLAEGHRRHGQGERGAPQGGELMAL